MIHVYGPPREGIYAPSSILCCDVPAGKRWHRIQQTVVFHPGLDRQAPPGSVCLECNSFTVPENP